MKKMLIKIILVLFSIIFFLSGCYTTFQPPLQGADDALSQANTLDQGEQAEMSTFESGATCIIPSAVVNDYDWYFYYLSPWWVDSDEFSWPGQPVSNVEPRDFRRRQPNMNTGDHIPRTQTLGPSVGTTLSKKAGSEDNSTSQDTDSRRGFSRRQPAKKGENSTGTRKRKR